MEGPPTEPQKRRLSKLEFLSKALDVLAREGNARLRVEELSRRLGVTTGSFYWHFKGREDFVRELLRHWKKVYTEQAIAAIEATAGSAERRLLVLMRILFEEEVPRYDSAFRSWAAQDPDVAAFVEEVDVRRRTFASSLFSEMGFESDDLAMRVRLFLVYESNQFDFRDRMPKEQRARILELRHRLLVTR